MAHCKKTNHQQYSEAIKNQVVGALQSGMTIGEVAEKYRIPSLTVKYFKKKFGTTGSVENKSRSGRPPRITEEMKAEVIQTAENNQRMPLADLGKNVTPAIGRDSVQEALCDDGIHRCKPL